MENEREYAGPLDISAEVSITEQRPKFAGTYSDVFIGKFRGQPVAVKVLKHINQKSLKAMQRKMFRERELWAALKHPNIVPFCGYAEGDDVFGLFGALISPWFKNGDAGKFLQACGDGMDIVARSMLWKGVISGVNYLHTYSPVIVHGDIKPGNILIDDGLNSRICDFGISRILAEEGPTGLTTTSEHTGTERYLSYELVISDEACAPTTASDVYALGCIGLEMIYLQSPHARRLNNLRGHIFQDIRKELPPAHRPEPLSAPYVPLWDLLESCWRREPEERPSTESISKSHEQWHLSIVELANKGIDAESRRHQGTSSPETTSNAPNSKKCGGVENQEAKSEQKPEHQLKASIIPIEHRRERLIRYEDTATQDVRGLQNQKMEMKTSSLAYDVHSRPIKTSRSRSRVRQAMEDDSSKELNTTHGEGKKNLKLNNDEPRAASQPSGTFTSQKLDLGMGDAPPPKSIPPVNREISPTLQPLRIATLDLSTPFEPPPGVEKAQPDTLVPQSLPLVTPSDIPEDTEMDTTTSFSRAPMNAAMFDNLGYLRAPTHTASPIIDDRLGDASENPFIMSYEETPVIHQVGPLHGNTTGKNK